MKVDKSNKKLKGIIEDGEYEYYAINEDEDSFLELEKGNTYKHSFISPIINIKSVYIKLMREEEQRGILEFKIKDIKNGVILTKGIIDLKEVSNGIWNEIKIPFVLGYLKEKLVIEIENKTKNKVKISINKNGVPCIKFKYNLYDEDTFKKINTIERELNEIYNSNGWELLIKIYKIRDTINKIFIQRIMKVFKIFYLVLKNLNITNFKKAVNYVKIYGIKSFLNKAIDKFRLSANINFDYNIWLKKNTLTDEEKAIQRTHFFKVSPKISIAVPTYNTSDEFLHEMIDSVIKQTYSNWELCIAEGGSDEKSVIEILKSYSERYPNIKVKYLTENKGIVGNTNEALKLATGEYVALLDHDDVLTENALFEMVNAINENENVDFIYSDEDKIDENTTKRFDPHFKPDFSPDTLRSFNYICHFTAIKKELLNKIGCLRDGFEGSQDYDLFLRATEIARNIIHIPKILYHWRVHSNSTAMNPASKLYAYEAGVKALEEHLVRIGVKGKVTIGQFYGIYNINYKIEKNHKISIIIPTKDHIDDLDRCISSINKKTRYKNYEFIIIENNSTEKSTFEYYEKLKKYNNIKVVYWDGEFNYAAINNFGIKHSTGEIVLLLNNDVEIINEDWLSNMLELAQREDVGAVGAKLYYPDDTIQHAGVILGLGGVAGHSHKYYKGTSSGYCSRLKVVQNLTASTAACLMMRREVFEAVGGFDENFKVAFNDIDLCMKIRQKKKLIVWTPFAELYHYESKSRGQENTPEKIERFRGEISRFKEKWDKELERGDPYYNPNLSLDFEDFSLSLK